MALNIALRLWLPHAGAVRLPYVVPAIEGVLLLVLLAGHPGVHTDRVRRLRLVALAFVLLLVVAALWSTVFLVYDLISGIGVTTSATKLLASGALIWLGNNLAF